MEFKEKIKKRLGIYIVYLVIGIVIIVMNALGVIKNETIGAFGTAIAFMGIIRIVQYSRMLRDDKLLAKQKIAESDERNLMIITKAKSLTFGIYALIGCVAIIVLEVMGMELAAQIAGFAICAYVLIYYVCYLVLRHKY